MKNFLILLVLLGLALPSFANEIKNERQIKDEVLLRAIVNSDTGRLSKHQTAFKEDYDLYKAGDKSSIYGQLLSLEKKYSNKTDMHSKLNIEYVDKVNALYLYLAEYPADKAMSTKFLEEFNSKKIILPDSEYELVDEDLVMLIMLINVYK